jgi:hypothetical protein
MINPNAGAWNTTIAACNHGTCPNTSGSGWNNYCWSPNGIAFGSVNLTGSTNPNQSGANDGYGGCTTSYSWSAGGNNHLCNDDAVWEMWQMNNGNLGAGSNNFTYNTSGWCEGSACGGGNPAYYGCEEDRNNGGSGTWNTPNCF